ncbi:MAG: M23 family metallopeptidase [Balneolaceae bacterium]
MSFENHFYYDEEKCEFIPISYSKKEQILYTACVWIINGVIISAIGLSLLSNYAGSPSELALTAENKILIQQLKHTQSAIINIEERVEEIAGLDNEMYRSVLGLEPIPYQERQQGIGGADPYDDFNFYSNEASDVLRWTASQLDKLERKINIQKLSFEEIKHYYNENQEKLRHLPAIRPVSGILLSGYGMRMHPVLKYRRMHEGVDFRADVGSEVFSTGDGIVKFAGRHGTYGLLLVIDHGFGYETRYAHLSGFAEGVKKGTKVQRGDLVAFSGNTGMTQGPHLHYEVIYNNKPVDPLNFLFADTTPEEYLMYQDIAKNNPNSMD